eukprot:1897188-Amphidinium_carterae.1
MLVSQHKAIHAVAVLKVSRVPPSQNVMLPCHSTTIESCTGVLHAQVAHFKHSSKEGLDVSQTLNIIKLATKPPK